MALGFHLRTSLPFTGEYSRYRARSIRACITDRGRALVFVVLGLLGSMEAVVFGVGLDFHGLA